MTSKDLKLIAMMSVHKMLEIELGIPHDEAVEMAKHYGDLFLQELELYSTVKKVEQELNK